MYLIYRLLFNAIGIVLIGELVPGIEIAGIYSAIIATFILAILNTLVRPVLILLTLPFTVITLGLFIFVLNAALFLFVASFIEGFTVDGFWNALLGSLLMSLVSVLGARLLRSSSQPQQPQTEPRGVTYREVREGED